jgi:Ca2+-binding RTX toxin-like protein
VRAEAGVSTIIAGSGGSHVDVGYGTVNLTAGSGVDVIDIGHGSGQATVSGFAQGTDKIDVHELHVSSYAELQAVASITSSGGNTTITVTGGDTITLVGVSSVTESDFVFSSTSSAMHC